MKKRHEKHFVRVSAHAAALTLLCLSSAESIAQQGQAQTVAEDPPVAEFDVWEYRVLGNNVLSARDVERAVYPYLGSGQTIDDVEAARLALEGAYRDAGYSTVFVDIPEQSVDEGIVRLSVTEGRIDRVRVTGARYFSNRQILEQLPALERGRTLFIPDLQAQLSEVNRRSGDRSVTPVLRAGRYPGTVDMELRVSDELPFSATFDVNNRYTADTTELRSSLTLGYSNLWQRADTVSLQYQTAPRNSSDAEVWAGTYVARLHEAKSLVAFYMVDSSSDVATVGNLSVLGQGRIAGARGIRLLEPVGSYSHNLTFGIDFKDFDESIRFDDADNLETAIKYINWSLNYAISNRFESSALDFTLGASWGLRGVGNDDFEFGQKRFLARANYRYATGTAQYLRQLPGNWELLTRAGWQYSAEPLISNEQFSAGGADSVRGYLEAERLGDTGANLSLEVRSRPFFSGERLHGLRFSLFVDAAAVEVRDPLPGQEARHRLLGAGFGVEISGLYGLDAAIDWARPLRDGSNVDDGDDRLHFGLNYTF